MGILSMYGVLEQILIIPAKISKTVFKSKNELIIENLALGQQLSTYKARKIKPTIKGRDRSFWIAQKNYGPKWTITFIISDKDLLIKSDT